MVATFTAEPIRPYLDFWLRAVNLTHGVEVEPPGLFFQKLFELAKTRLSSVDLAIVLLIRLEDWEMEFRDAGCDGSFANNSQRCIESNLQQVIETLTNLVSLGGPLCFLIFTPSSPQSLQDPDRVEFFHQQELLVRNQFKGKAVITIGSDELVNTQVKGSYYDSYSDVVAEIPYSEEFFAQMAASIVRKMYVSQVSPFKVITLDADGTLWKGLCAETGPEGIDVDPEREFLQSFLVGQRDGGRLLCLCSKNDAADVRATFEKNPQMSLKWSDFTAKRIDWRPKSESLRSIAVELGLGLDSFIFIDDSPIECAEAASGCPEVLTLLLPAEPGQIPTFLQNQWGFDFPPWTKENINRAEFYERKKEREQLRRRIPTLASFLANLQLEVQIRSPESSEWERVCELTFRTNQFNCTTIRRSLGDLSRLLKAGGECLVVQAKDRFGDYGLVGVVLFRIAESALEVDTFLLSCRALGRGIEHRMLAYLGEIALDRGCESVSVPFVPTNRNQPVLRFLEEVGQSHEIMAQGERRYRWPAGEASAIKLDTTGHPLGTSGGDSGERPPLETLSPSEEYLERNAVLQRIAQELADLRSVVKAVHSRQSQENRRVTNPSTLPCTPMEKKLAAIWSDLLGCSAVGMYDNFFELGGNSIQAVRLTSQVRDAFGIELSLGEFFQDPTLAALCKLVFGPLVDRCSTDLSKNLVEWIEQLSEDEASRLLNQPVKSPLPVPQVEERQKGEMTGRGMTTKTIAILERCNLAATTVLSPAVISTLGIMTCNRPAALDRALRGYLRNVVRASRNHTTIAVLDDSHDLGAQGATRAVIRSLKSVDRERVVYADHVCKRHFAESLVSATRIPPEILEFGLFDPLGIGHSLGANRNALALEATGEVYFTADDDTICDIGPSPNFEKGVSIISGHDPCELWTFENHEEALQSVRFVEADLLGLHETTLGRSVVEIVAREAANDSLLEISDPLGFTVPRIVNGLGRVLVTFNGLVGDCAWGAPFGFWGAPMGYLLLSGSSLSRMVKSEEDYRTALTRRDVLRAVRRITLSDGTCGMLTFAGLDNCDILPPFIPVRRGQDLVFCATLQICSEEALFAHLPWVLHHSPVEVRRFWRGEFIRTAGSFDTTKLVLECLAACCPTEVHGRRERMKALGHSLVALGALPLDDFELLLRRQAGKSALRLATHAEQTIASAGGGPEFWVADVKRYIDLQFRALDTQVAVVPLDLVQGNDLRGALSLGQELVGRFGDLLTWWPTLVQEAYEQRTRGRRLAIPVD